MALKLVVAPDELLRTRRPTRLLALIEASVGVGGGLLVLQQLASLPQIPAGCDVTRWTLIGSVSLGLGAVVNRGCVLGTVARIGSGEWALPGNAFRLLSRLHQCGPGVLTAPRRMVW